MLYDSYSYTMFPTGLIDFILKNKHKRKIRLEDGTYEEGFEHYTIEVDSIRDNRTKPKTPIGQINLWNEKTDSFLILHDYQEEAIKVFLEKKRGIIRLSTGSGKTVLAIGLTQILNCKTLFVAHTKDLVRQAQVQYKAKANIDTGFIGNSEWNPKEVTVATIQTLSRRLNEKYVQEFLARVEFVVWDEGHHASKTYQEVSRALRNAYYRLSLSATVGMGDKQEKLQAMALSGPLIYDVKMEKLVENKQLAKPTAIFVRIPHMPGDPPWELMNFQEQYEQGIMYNEFRNMVLAQAAMEMKEHGYSSLILVEKLIHGKSIIKNLKDYKYKIAYVSGKDSADTRDDAALDLQSGELDVLITSRIFNEGRDLPNLQSVIVASGYKAAGLTLQRAGRGVRKTPIKDTTTIIDCYDEFAPKLLRHSEARLNTLRKNKAFDVEVIEWTDLEKVLEELMEKRRKK